jgi:thiamine biosynthesis protein ThiS
MTVKKLIEKMNYTYPLLIVRVNGTLIDENEYASVTVYDEDDVKIIHPIAGG